MIANSTVPCGIAIPQVFTDGQPVDMTLVREFVARAELLGYDSIWVQEQIIGQAPVLEPLALLSYVAAVTRDIRMGTAVIITTTRNPILLAKQIATVDAMSGGRLIAGLALGGRPGDYGTLDGPSSHRVGHFLESLRLMRALWSQERVDFAGRFWQLEAAWIAPRPVQQPLPVWFGGRHPDALRRAAPTTATGGWAPDRRRRPSSPSTCGLSGAGWMRRDVIPRRSRYPSASTWRWTTTGPARSGGCGSGSASGTRRGRS